MAIERRVASLEAEILAVDPVRIKTVILVYARGNEEPCRSIEDVFEFNSRDPVVELVRRVDDLDVLIDAETGTHVRRWQDEDGQDDEYDDLAVGVRVIEVEIACHEAQLEQIISDTLVTATKGGVRAGKTRVLVWWMFRQWLLRGHGVDEDNPKPALMWWIREDSEKLYEHAIQWLVNLWPPDVFIGKMPGSTTKHPKLYLCDGTVIAFRHANHSGGKAGTNLRSASVEVIVVDELSAIVNEENWRELQARVSQTGGRIAVAYTPTTGHWSVEAVEHAAATSGGAIRLRSIMMRDNPWWPYARCWSAFLRSGDLDAAQVLDVLAAPDSFARAMELIQDPDARRRHFGESAVVGLRLWRSWDAERYTIQGPAIFVPEFNVGGVFHPNITEHALGASFGRAGRAIDRGGGVDFNVNPGVALVFQVFGTLRRPIVVVLDEVETIGPTTKSAQHIARRYPGLCLHCDPTGALDGRPAAHGAKGQTNAQELEDHGLYVEPANGYHGNKVNQLPQIDSINVLHKAMDLGLLWVHARCSGTLRALRDMKAKPDGTILKTPGRNSKSDQVSANGDALRYGVWPIFRELYG